MKQFKINGKTYNAKPFDFNMMCDLEDLGVDLAKAQTKPMGMVRTYAQLCMGVDAETAGAEINEHIVNGGTLESIMLPMGEMMSDSGFFRQLAKGMEKETPKIPRKKSTEV